MPIKRYGAEKAGAGGQNLPLAHDDSAHWHLARQPGVVRLVQRQAHEALVAQGQVGVGAHGCASLARCAAAASERLARLVEHLDFKSIPTICFQAAKYYPHNAPCRGG